MDEIIQKMNWEKNNGLVPIIAQEFKTGRVLMLGFMNQEALKQTLQIGKVVYYSRTRKKLWQKGETSGNFQIVKEIWFDCDRDTVLIKVDQIGDVCHTGKDTCFFEKICPA